MKLFRNILLAALVFVAGLSFMSGAQNRGERDGGEQEERDSLVILLSSKSAQVVDIEGASYRKIVGPARFLHNGTYLLCDTALWNVETKVIDAWGNVSILQEETVLTSDKLTYFIDSDLAEFRGSVVQLTDKDHNTLRTRYLDYNTADSVAVFQKGGAMRDKDGQIIESRNGTYDSKIKKFTFEKDVNMFTDSIFVKTNLLIYESDKDLATFGSVTDVWKDENMLSSNSGWYDRGQEVFFFNNNVHLMSEDQEGWCDTLYFYRNTSNIDMLGNAQVMDTTRNVFGLAGRIEYVDSISKVIMTRKPAVISETEEEDATVDTVYLGAEKLVYYTIKKCDIDSLVVLDAGKRLESLNVDPVGEYRKKAAEAAAKAAEEAAMNDPNYRAKMEAMEKQGGKPGAQQGGKPQAGPKAGPQGRPSGQQPQGRPQQPSGAKSLTPPASSAKAPAAKVSAAPPIAETLAVADTLAQPSAPVAKDSLMQPARPVLTDTLAKPDAMAADMSVLPDSLGVIQQVDSLALSDSLTVVEEPKDTTKIGFLEAIRNVKVYKKSMQVVCDSLLYSDLDSLGRLFKEPIIWQEVTRQYSADSISVVVKNNSMQKASLMSNAFITIQEDETHYDQIKGTEMLAFFDDKGGLERFDVLGGASALFYIEENDALATVNKPESKMLSATFRNGELQRIYYYDQAKNDAYPVVQLSDDEQQLKGYNWQPEKRPADRNAVTPLSLRPSERQKYSARPKTKFTQTDIYFPGYMQDVYRQIEVRDSLRQVRERERKIAEANAKRQAQLDSIALADSLVLADSLARMDSLAVKDSLLNASVADSLSLADSLDAAAVDSLAVRDTAAAVMQLTPQQQKAAERAAKKAAAAQVKAEKQAARDAKKKAKQEALEAKWAELDKRDAEKAAVKAAKKLEKERARKRRALESQARQQRKEMELLEKYRRKYLEQQSRERSRQ